MFAYDTLKAYKSSEWQELTQSATAFSEIIKGDPEGIIGLTSFQLTDHSQLHSPEDLSSMNIATAKHILHVADNMIMFLRLKNEDYGTYKYISIDNNSIKPLEKDRFYTVAKIIKNRSGGGKEKLYLLDVNYATNVWIENGEIIKKGKG